MGKYAVTIGVNYTDNPEAALKGCINDSHIMRSILLSKGFEDKNIRMLNDEDSGAERPTGANVRKALDWLCHNRSADDYIFLHFSGHGSQIKSDGDDHEADGKDEVLCCAGLFLYADDDLKQHISQLPKGTKATVITDCCHSGGMLDHEPVNLAIGGDKAEDGGTREATCPESQARSLPVSTIASFLSSQLGKPVEPTRSGIAGGQASFFGGDASKLAMRFAASQMKGGGGGGNPLAALLGGGGGAGGAGGAGAAAAIGGMAMAAMAGGGKGGENPLAGILSQLGLGGVKSATAEGAPPYVPTDQPLSDDLGILITGCESHQTSADVRPPGGKPHGALTASIRDVYNRNPNASYKELVLGVRQELHKKGFSQNPQLECAAGLTDEPFICPGGTKADESKASYNGVTDFTAAPSSENAKPSGKTPAGGEAASGGDPLAPAGGLAKLFKSCLGK